MICTMPGRVYNEIFDIAIDQHGFVTAHDAKEAGFDVRRLHDLKVRGQADQLDIGLYRLTAIPPTRFDQYMQAALWHHGLGVISHETALDLWDVCDINPAKLHVTIPFKPRLTRTPPALYVIHKAVLQDRERTVMEAVPIVTLEHAIRQCIGMHTRPDLLRQAIDNGRKVGKLRPSVADQLVQELAPERVAS
jgi:predicted transcriptional regulator of viral defense system